MSMLKSLQSMPGVITIFHSPKFPLSTKLLEKLKSNATDKLRKASTKKKQLETRSPIQTFLNCGGNNSSSAKGLKQNYQIDICNKVPTVEQFNFIKQTLSMNPACKKAFNDAFPNLSSSSINNNVFELQKLDSSLLLELETKSLEQLAEDGVFQPPLIVDWDNKLIASDLNNLDKILKNYDKNEEGI